MDNKMQEKEEVLHSFIAIKKTMRDFGLDIEVELESNNGEKRSVNALVTLENHIVDFMADSMIEE